MIDGRDAVPAASNAPNDHHCRNELAMRTSVSQHPSSSSSSFVDVRHEV